MRIVTQELKDNVDDLHESLLLRQDAEMTESSIFVFDLSKESNVVPLDPYSLLLYVGGLLPAVPGVLVPCGNYGYVSFRPANLERDDHLVLVKLKNQSDPEVLETVIQALCEDLGDDVFIKVGMMMKKMITTMKQRKKKKSIFQRISSLVLTQPTSSDTKKEILLLWFSHAILGPVFITRSLELIQFDEPVASKAICCSTTNKIKGRNRWSFWDFSMDHVILMDRNYFIFDGEDCEDMDYPQEIKCNYIGLKDEKSKIQSVTERFLCNCEKSYMDKLDHSDYNSYHIDIVKTEAGPKRLKLQYGGGVFYGMLGTLIEIVNGVRFYDWRKTTPGVGWELWLGRDEQSKLKDYRTLKEENSKLQREIAKLRKLLRNQSNEQQ